MSYYEQKSHVRIVQIRWEFFVPCGHEVVHRCSFNLPNFRCVVHLRSGVRVVKSKMPEEMARVHWNPIAAAKHIASMLDAINEALCISAGKVPCHFSCFIDFYSFIFLLTG